MLLSDLVNGLGMNVGAVGPGRAGPYMPQIQPAPEYADFKQNYWAPDREQVLQNMLASQPKPGWDPAQMAAAHPGWQYGQGQIRMGLGGGMQLPGNPWALFNQATNPWGMGGGFSGWGPGLTSLGQFAAPFAGFRPAARLDYAPRFGFGPR